MAAQKNVGSRSPGGGRSKRQTPTIPNSGVAGDTSDVVDAQERTPKKTRGPKARKRSLAQPEASGEDERKAGALDEPGVDEPGIDDPSVDEPDLDEPDLDEPDLDEPDLDEPDLDEPSPEDPDRVDDGEGANKKASFRSKRAREDVAEEEAFDGDEQEADRSVALQEEAVRDHEDVFQPPQAALARADKSLARLDPMQAYMREVQQHSLLTPEEEKALAVRYAETGDVAAAARLVTSNLRLVVKIAYEYRRAYRNMMDLVQEGNMGLMQAVKKYDPYRGVKLSSYAAWWIRAYMLRYILANWRMVKLGTTQAQRKLFFNLNKEKARLSAMGIEPTSAEIAKRLDVTESEVDEMDKRMSRNDASLDLPVNEADGRQISRVELMPAPGTTPDVATEGAELGHLLRLHLEEFRGTLSGKDLQIFDERLVADEPRTLQELGTEFGVSRERVRQLEARITGHLRRFLSERLGDAVEVSS